MSDELKIPPVPPGTGAAGRRLWRGTLSIYDLAAHELETLREAVRTADVLDRLDREAATAELLVTDKRGELKANPLLVEARQQRAVYIRLLASLRLPDQDTADRPQHRGAARGAYSGSRTGPVGRGNEQVSYLASRREA